MPKNIKRFTVSVDLPQGMTIEDMKEYIQEAVQSYKGGYNPTSPAYALDVETVKVFRYCKPPKSKIKPPLKTYYSCSFDGPYPIGVCALVRACNKTEAAKLLNAKLDGYTVEDEPFEWKGDQRARDMEEVIEEVYIINDGVY